MLKRKLFSGIFTCAPNWPSLSAANIPCATSKTRAHFGAHKLSLNRTVTVSISAGHAVGFIACSSV